MASEQEETQLTRYLHLTNSRKRVRTRIATSTPTVSIWQDLIQWAATVSGKTMTKLPCPDTFIVMVRCKQGFWDDGYIPLAVCVRACVPACVRAYICLCACRNIMWMPLWYDEWFYHKNNKSISSLTLKYCPCPHPMCRCSPLSIFIHFFWLLVC